MITFRGLVSRFRGGNDGIMIEDGGAGEEEGWVVGMWFLTSASSFRNRW